MRARRPTVVPPDTASSAAAAHEGGGRLRRPVALERLGPTQLIALLAISMSLTALGIDLVLPAFGDIRGDLGLAIDSNATAGLVTAYFIGLALGQLGFGVLADGRGRRPALFLGYAIYIAGAVASVLAPSLTWLLAARVLWGVGAASGRVVTLAVIRDTWSGDRMSRAMSFVMAVFIVVPVVSPTVGSLLLAVMSWRWLFAVCALAAASVAVWALRLPETLSVADRRSMRPGRVVEAARITGSQRQTVTGGLGLMLLYGAFTSWIGSSELIITDVFGRGEQFPVIFGGIAAVLGIGMLTNARLVERFGTRRVTLAALGGYLLVAALLVVLVVLSGGTPGFWPFAITLALLLGAHALLVPNVNALAMEPVGHVAGTASALLGSVQIAGGAALGAVVDRLYDGTVLPLAAGFLGFGFVGAAIVAWGVRDLAPAPAPAR